MRHLRPELPELPPDMPVLLITPLDSAAPQLVRSYAQLLEDQCSHHKVLRDKVKDRVAELRAWAQEMEDYQIRTHCGEFRFEEPGLAPDPAVEVHQAQAKRARGRKVRDAFD